MLNRRDFLGMLGAASLPPVRDVASIWPGRQPLVRRWPSVQAVLDAHVGRRATAGAVAALSYGDAPVACLTAGGIALDSDRRPHENSIYRMYSTTKVVIPAIALIASTCIGCSQARSIGETAAAGSGHQHGHVIDHFVSHVSTARANEGARVSLFLRERRRAPSGPVVLLVHGRAAAALPSFDLEYRDYSWLTYLADAGFGAFALDLQGYGNSSRPSVMDDPCNTSAENQAKYLVPHPLAAPCPPRYQQPFGSFATDWDEIDTAVEFIRSVRGDRALRVNLVGWSRGGMRVIGYAALRPGNIDKVVALNPTRFPPLTTVPGYPTNMTDERDFFASWDEQIDSRNCPQQFDPSIREALWKATIAQDRLGSGWGASGVRRSPSFSSAGWTADLPGRVQAPTLVIRGALDRQAPEPATRALYDALGGPKRYLTVSCGSHEVVYERQHTTVLQAIVAWLRS